MLLKNYVFWKEALPLSLCDQIVKYGTQQPSQEGKLGPELKSKKEIRDSTISFFKCYLDFRLDKRTITKCK